MKRARRIRAIVAKFVQLKSEYPVSKYEFDLLIFQIMLFLEREDSGN